MPASTVWRLLLLGLLAAAARGDSTFRRFNMSLDAPPSQRWGPILRQYNIPLLKKFLDEIVRSVAPQWAIHVVNQLAPVLTNILPQPYQEEIEGISKILDVNLGDVLLVNFAYEILGYCTSIVAQDTRGIIYHGRNMDFAFSDILRIITVDIQYVKKDQIAYTGTTFLGFVGLWTGQKPNKFSISGNERAKVNWWKTAIAAILKKSPSPSWLIRDTLSEATNYHEALKKLACTPINANVYFILGGVKQNEGTIITRDLNKPVDIWPLKPAEGQWYRVQTNYDHWKSPPSWDDRRTPANRALNYTMQKNINLNTMFKVLSIRPVLNERTVYTTIMCAARSDYKTIIRSGKTNKLDYKKNYTAA
ncbi:N-acylethanolamine-hydrolyzing acid amidase-like [Narcine bancroftii]|uniref:N-acylethanolamine-hydrolyzing acid amidase-like n=1 Tax=Narcine bancroftii TaxID=1343680 RepID=UPI003831432E